MLLNLLRFLAAFLPAFAAGADRPNILWITAEDFSANLGCYGDTFARTPAIDAFAREAVRYTRAYAFAPVCAPSRATLITGVNANSLGNPHLRCEIVLPQTFKGYPAYLRDGGYFTSNNVKTDYNLRGEGEIARQWWSRIGPQAHWRERAAGQPFMAVFNFMETHQSRTSVMTAGEFEREIGSKLLESERADPQRAPVPPFYPDTPMARAAMARYYDCATVMDKKVGALLAQLASDGLADDTIVFFYSDHGMGMPRGKRLLHDSGMHVPLLIRFPKKWAHLAPAPAGATVDRMVTFVDFPATLLSLVSLPIPAHFQGTAFLGAATGAPRRRVESARDRVDEAFDTARSIRDERWLYIRNYRPHLSWTPPEGYSDASAFRRDLRAKATAGKLGTGPTAWLAATRPREELYDSHADPHHLVNLAAKPEHAATLQRLRGELRAWLVEVRDAAFMAEEDAAARAGGGSIYEAVRRPGVYPFERVLAAAEAVGDPAAVAQQRKWLSDTDAAVRYWAAIGFTANRAGATQARAELERALGDASAAVRIEAAGALLVATGDAKARAVLERELRGEASYPALHAARALELAGPAAGASREVMKTRHATAVRRQGGEALELYVGFALSAWLQAFGEGAP